MPVRWAIQGTSRMLLLHCRSNRSSSLVLFHAAGLELLAALARAWIVAPDHPRTMLMTTPRTCDEASEHPLFVGKLYLQPFLFSLKLRDLLPILLRFGWMVRAGCVSQVVDDRSR